MLSTISTFADAIKDCEEKLKKYFYEAKAYEKGIGVEKNHEKAIYRYGDILKPSKFRYSKTTQKIFKKTFNILDIYSKQGDPDASYQLGRLYSDPDYILYDNKKALEYYKQGALQEHPYCLFELGDFYLRGTLQFENPETDEKDIAITTLLMIRAANLGYKYAQHRAAQIYFLWKNKPFVASLLSVYDAFVYLEKASKQDVYNATFNLAVCYFNGSGVEKDQEKAVKIWETLLNRNDIQVFTIKRLQEVLAYCYYNGYGTKKDIEKAKGVMMYPHKDTKELEDFLSNYGVGIVYFYY